MLKKSVKGATVRELSNSLINDEVTEEEAYFFVNELINNQVLISQLSPFVSGEDNFLTLYGTVKNLMIPKTELDFLNNLHSFIDGIGESSETNLGIYENLQEILNKNYIDIKDKPAIQADLKLTGENPTLDKSIVDSVKMGLTALNKLSSKYSGHKRLDEFKIAFFDRYQDEEVPLALVMDVEMGLGYPQGQGSGVICPLIDDIQLPKPDVEIKTFELTKTHTFFYQKLISAVSKEEYVLCIKDEDLQDLEDFWEDLPDTISIMVELLKVKGETKIKMSGIQGSSAVNLLARFCYLDVDIRDHVNEITKYERGVYPEKLVAEIVHIPESRTGNILLRPVLRSFEIPYLAKSVLNIENQISVKDLTVSLRGNEIILKSKKLNKEIIPRLSNAHNYLTSKLPIYQFLCDLQTQNKREEMFLDLGPLVNGFDFTPRIEYSNIILRYAVWNIKSQEIVGLYEHRENVEELSKQLRIFRNKRRIPKFVVLVEGDNELLINFENTTCAFMFLDLVKNKNNIVLREFPFDKDCYVTDPKGKSSYTNQIILSFKKSHEN